MEDASSLPAVAGSGLPRGKSYDELVGWMRPYEQETQILQALLANGLAPARTSVIELGCGTGTISVRLARSGDVSVAGVDHDPVMVGQARRKAAGLANLHFFCADLLGDVSHIAPANAAFAPFSLVFNFFPRARLRRFLENCATLLQEGGLLLLNGFTASRTHAELIPTRYVARGRGPGAASGTYVRAFVEGELTTLVFYYPLEKWGRYAISRHVLNAYTPERLAAVAGSVGFSVERIVAGPTGSTYSPVHSPEYWLVLRRNAGG